LYHPTKVTYDELNDVCGLSLIMLTETAKI